MLSRPVISLENANKVEPLQPLKGPHMTCNHLAEATSPYLLQHKDNPVHWWPWGEDALNEAKRTNKPILLSVGYAACHWCHVMAHESFEDHATAEVMNDLYVNIKVDREERPDVDAIYMTALHSLGEQGGWPLTMFLTPDGEPFWGGTYFPNEQRFGRPSFTHVLREISRIFHREPNKVANNARLVMSRLREEPIQTETLQLTEGVLADLAPRLASIVDTTYGGIQGAPKFPQFGFFWLLWRLGKRFDKVEAKNSVTHTLSAICRGGIYDHLGGGFARYSVDERWLLPHFEKMLYDNALLIELITEVWRETQNPLFERRVAETVEWLEREMTTEGGKGAFSCSLDADSEGEEGRFYVWRADEIEHVLGKEDAVLFSAAYGINPGGNWEGNNVLNQLSAKNPENDDKQNRLAEFRRELWRVREKRVRPGLDDKVLADWNGLMIAALARAGWMFGRDDWLALAKQAYDFICAKLSFGERLQHSYRDGKTGSPATASDYANMIWAAIRLHEAQLPLSKGNNHYLKQALKWLGILDQYYWVRGIGGYALAANDTRGLIVRTRSASDDAAPNANAVMLSNLVQLFQLTGDDRHYKRAQQLLDAFHHDTAHNLVAHAGFLAGAMDVFTPAQVIIISGDDLAGTALLQSALKQVSTPGMSIQTVVDTTHVPQSSPLFGKKALDGRATAFVCVGSQCSLPETDGRALVELLSKELTLRRLAESKILRR